MKSRIGPVNLHVDAPVNIGVSLLETLFDQVEDVAFFVKDARGRYLAVNPSLVRRHGLKSKEDVLGKRPCDICEGEFGRLPSQQDIQVLSSGQPMLDHLEMQWHQPYQPVWCFTTKLPIRDSHGNICGLIGTSRDVRAPVDVDQIPQLFVKAIQAFQKDPSSIEGVSGLAEAAEVTSSRLAKLTKQLFGLTPNQWITKQRISTASRLLLNPDLAVSQIAQMCGYYDHSAFARAFRNATGLTPSEFRSQPPHRLLTPTVAGLGSLGGLSTSAGWM